MSEQNRYRISSNYKTERGSEWTGWLEDGHNGWPGDTWQDATCKKLDDIKWIVGEYQVVSETPAEDGRSGILEIQLLERAALWVEVKLKATIIED